jgi:acetylornithine deacetylase/succinyl-diaminopimelate desuccinylase-like protein
MMLLHGSASSGSPIVMPEAAVIASHACSPVEALDPGKRGGGDISYISEYVDALDGLGVKGMRSHTPYERVNLRSIRPATERAAILIYRLLHR